MPTPRKRSVLALAVVTVVGLGLASRAFPFLLPAAWAQYPGDALWAVMVLFGIALICPRITPRRLAGVALAVSYAVEFSQLYQGAWAQTVRATRIGHLAFGAGFDWLDLVAYTLGTAVGFVVDLRFFYACRGTQKTDRPPVGPRPSSISQ